MLTSLQIKNFVLIDDLEIDFRDGFSVLTGQTGAGKSIILGALNFLMGQRADNRVIAENREKCSIEGHFDISGYGFEQLFTENGCDYDPADTIFRREISVSGKSRAFINDTPVSLSVMKEIGSHLINIHSQHQTLLLGTQSFQTAVLDSIAGNTALREEYSRCFSAYNRDKHALDRLKEEDSAGRNELEYLQYQFDELTEAGLTEEEQNELEAEQSFLMHTEEIKEALYRSGELIYGDNSGAISPLMMALQSLKEAAGKMSTIQELTDRMHSCIIELKDIGSEIAGIENRISFDPERMQAVTDRLDLIYSLQKKHHCSSMYELIGYRESLREKLDRSGSVGYDIDRLERLVKEDFSQTEAAARQLSDTRIKAAQQAESAIMSGLVPLGLPNAAFKVDISSKEHFQENGKDDIHFMFSANQGVALQDISAVASGGELSRVMLVIKSLLAGAVNLPTMIFDEIDTGVSGAVAEQMALLMRRMCAGGCQVLAISHLPQIAAKSDCHYLVYKVEDNSSTHTYIKLLDREQRIMEIARMMSGSVITDAALNNAKTLIEE